MEDDCVPQIGFFKFCEKMLIKYSSNNNIAHISGCNLYYGISKKKIGIKNLKIIGKFQKVVQKKFLKIF